METFISIENLWYSSKRKDILKEINIDICKGATLALLGPNGSGKSTLLDVILSDIKPSGGRVAYNFNKPRFFKNNIGVVYNNQHIFPQLFVRELVDFYKKVYRSDGVFLSELLRLFDLEKLKNTLIRELSEGEKKKLSIALGIFHKPELIVMDEPFSNVDITMTGIIWQEIKKMNATVIIATHNWGFAEKCADDILFLYEGQQLYEKFQPARKNIIISADKKLVTYKNEALIPMLPEGGYYEKDYHLNIPVTPEIDLESIKSTTFNYSVIDISLEDIFYCLTLNNNNKC